MTMHEAVFLSASVPDPNRGPKYAATADVVAITSAVSALVYVTLGRRALVWGGHPAITPMVWTVAGNLNVDYGSWVRLYQSKHFQDEFPQDNEKFQNVIYTDEIDGDREKSLKEMRQRMFTEQQFAAAVFIGGMGGVIDEFTLFRECQPNASVLPIVSTGGASIVVAEELQSIENDMRFELDYIALFHKHLQISERELRFNRVENQPPDKKDRLWTKPS